MKIIKNEGEINQLKEQIRNLSEDKSNNNNNNNNNEKEESHGITLGSIVEEEKKTK